MSEVEIKAKMSDENPTSVTGVVLGAVTMQADLRTRTNFSVLHLLAACQFSGVVGSLEVANRGNAFGPFWEEILANASASVLLTIAALESYLNELFADRNSNFPGIRNEIVLKLWESNEQKPMLDKFDLALLVRNKGSVDRGSAPAQDISALIRLRNALIHFKPEWFDEQQEHAKLSSQLAGRFAPSPFFGISEPLFPRGWATHGCTSWATKSAMNFIDAFDCQAGFPSRLANFRTRLTP